MFAIRSEYRSDDARGAVDEAVFHAVVVGEHAAHSDVDVQHAQLAASRGVDLLSRSVVVDRPRICGCSVDGVDDLDEAGSGVRFSSRDCYLRSGDVDGGERRQGD